METLAAAIGLLAAREVGFGQQVEPQYRHCISSRYDICIRELLAMSYEHDLGVNFYINYSHACAC